MSQERIELSAERIYRSAWLLYLLLAIAGAVWLGLANRDEGGIVLSLFVDAETWPFDLLWGVGTGAGLLLLWLAGRTVLPLARELEATLADLLGGLTVSDALALALISGFAEELFFRGAVQGSFGIVPATILFALLHGGPGRAFFLWTVFALVAGAAFGGLAMLRGNLLASVAAHVLVNAVNLRRLALAGAETGARDSAETGAEAAPPPPSEDR